MIILCTCCVDGQRELPLKTAAGSSGPSISAKTPALFSFSGGASCSQQQSPSPPPPSPPLHCEAEADSLLFFLLLLIVFPSTFPPHSSISSSLARSRVLQPSAPATQSGLFLSPSYRKKLSRLGVNYVRPRQLLTLVPAVHVTSDQGALRIHARTRTYGAHNQCRVLCMLLSLPLALVAVLVDENFTYTPRGRIVLSHCLSLSLRTFRVGM